MPPMTGAIDTTGSAVPGRPPEVPRSPLWNKKIPIPRLPPEAADTGLV